MPLSEQEQRLLEEMERSLYHNDADYVAGAAGSHGKPTYARIVAGVLVGVLGIATLIAGVALHLPIVGVVGFVLMFVGVLIALTPPRRTLGSRGPQAPAADATPDAASGGKAAGGSFFQNLGERWDNQPDDREE
ncbi:MAG TPA: DUF3040 domain-containing protein [Galbitalea sp.]|jgi:hypothetical protein|nr:DUF3040 domain-containing protein [Galbitalea sp.]